MVEQPRIIHTSRVESWRIPEVSYNQKSGTFELIGEMTPAMPQDKLAQKYGIEIPNTQLLWAIASKAYDLKNESPKEAESLRNFLRQGFRQYPNTLTRIIYTPSGKDEIVHNYGTSDKYSFNENVSGPDSLIANMKDKKISESFLGTSDTDNVNNVSNWINGTNFHFWRLNSKPKQKEERVAGFGGSGRYLDCDRDPLSGYPAFRVLRVE